MKKQSEKALFISLWILIILGVALWKFWPTFQVKVDPTPVMLSKELEVMFGGGRVKAFGGTHINLEISVNHDYQSRVAGESKRVSLGFHLMRKDTSFSTGHINVAIPISDKYLSLELPNPQGSRPTAIQLFLTP